MKSIPLLLLFCSVGLAQSPSADPSKYFKHLIIIVQENRTPDNLLWACTTYPGIVPANYDLVNSGLAGSKVITSTPVSLSGDYDPNHSHASWVAQYDKGKMDGAYLVTDACNAKAPDCWNKGKNQNLSYKYVDNSKGAINPYCSIMAQYGFANNFFQTNQGPSYPAHQYLFGGTSAATATDDANALFIEENPSAPAGANYKPGDWSGCLAPIGEWNHTIDSTGADAQITNSGGTFCYSHATLASVLDSKGLTWRYYEGSAGSIWSAPNTISSICVPNSSYTQCTGTEFSNNVKNTSKILTDIGDCKLKDVSWVVPSGNNSDHSGSNTGGGPSWVASIVNAVGNNTNCDGSGYWGNTAVLITWDDWGGWYDHVVPPILSGAQGDYQLGFRVPLLIVSAYTPVAYVSKTQSDFGSILRLAEEVVGLQAGAIGFADARSTSDLSDYFDFSAPKRTFVTISAPLSPQHFIEERDDSDPDDD